jgi:hypothetical protein
VSGKSYTTVENGLRVVEVGRITGSVDKCGELDRRFRPLRRRDRGERQRRARLAAAMSDPLPGRPIPPVSLYRYAGHYFVVDGHRRVAAALAAGIEYLDAYVTDVVLQGNRAAVQASLSRKRFEAETGLMNLRLDQEAGYTDLLAQIAEFPGGARAWYSSVFLPACRQIEKSGLPELFPDLRAGDLYVLVLRFHRDFDSGFPRGADFQAVLDRFIAFRGRRGFWRRLWQFFRRRGSVRPRPT